MSHIAARVDRRLFLAALRSGRLGKALIGGCWASPVIRLRCGLLVILSLLSAGQPTTANELVEREAISSLTQRALLAGDFGKLEETSRGYRTARSRTSSGLWKLTLFYAGIEAAIEDTSKRGEPGFNEMEARIRTWSERYPNSPAAHIAYSMVLIEHGWAFRGTGYASEVRRESWAPFRRYISMARHNLEKYKSIAAVDPRWYETMLIVARAEGWDRDHFDVLLKEALGREPLFYQTYFQALQYLLPKWRGNTVEIEKFAQAAVVQTSKEEGTGMYARIYWYASQTEFQNDIFTNSLAFWPRMRAGFEDVIARYPDAWNLNNYARFACLAQDKPKTKELLRRVEATIVLEAWEPMDLLQRCSKWAMK